MEATELRIGNYVEHQIHKIGTVQSLGDTTLLISTNYDEIELIEIEPIPLTEEWLLKFGFTQISEFSRIWSLNNYGFDLGITYFFLQSIIEEDVIAFNGGKKIQTKLIWIRTKCKYVHQLQNLYYALIVGEELTIK